MNCVFCASAVDLLNAMTKIHDCIYCSIARIAILIEILFSTAISIAIRLFLNIACNTAILFGPYFHNIQLQYFFSGQILTQ